MELSLRSRTIGVLLAVANALGCTTGSSGPPTSDGGGLFGAFNVPTTTAVRVRAVGIHGGGTHLVGSYALRAFSGAVTAVTLRGRPPASN